MLLTNSFWRPIVIGLWEDYQVPQYEMHEIHVCGDTFLLLCELLCQKSCPNSRVGFGLFPVYFSGLCCIPSHFLPQAVPVYDVPASGSCSPAPLGVVRAWGHLSGRLHSLTRQEEFVVTGIPATAWVSLHPHSQLFLLINVLMGSRVPAFFLWD